MSTVSAFVAATRAIDISKRKSIGGLFELLPAQGSDEDAASTRPDSSRGRVPSAGTTIRALGNTDGAAGVATNSAPEKIATPRQDVRVEEAAIPSLSRRAATNCGIEEIEGLLDGYGPG
jgi:hypothetical protein